MVQTLAADGEFDHPTLDSPGWWERFDRLCYPPFSRRNNQDGIGVRRTSIQKASSRPLIITGANGTLGSAFARICERRGLTYHLLNRQELDIADPRSIEEALETFEPWAVINSAGYVRVDEAENDQETCLRENALGPELLAEYCKTRDLSLLTFSSDLVFNGKTRRPYVESDQVLPLNVYGATKARAEGSLLSIFPQGLVIRTSAFFGPWDQHNFASKVLDALSHGLMFEAASDEQVSPTYIPDLVHASLDLLIDGECGVWHLTNEGALTWADFARMLAQRAGYDPNQIRGLRGCLLGRSARRPTYSALTSERGTFLPSLENAIDRYLMEIAHLRCVDDALKPSQIAGLSQLKQDAAAKTSSSY